MVSWAKASAAAGSGAELRAGAALQRVNRFDATLEHRAHPTLTGVVKATYTTPPVAFGSLVMAFVRRIGRSFYLVHNVRRGGKVKQLHLAKLGERPRITDDVVRSVTRQHRSLKLNWSRLREEVNSRTEVLGGGAEYLRKLSNSILRLNLDLADLSPPAPPVPARAAGRDIVSRLRLLRSTVEVKLDQFSRAAGPGVVPAGGSGRRVKP